MAGGLEIAFSFHVQFVQPSSRCEGLARSGESGNGPQTADRLFLPGRSRACCIIEDAAWMCHESHGKDMVADGHSRLCRENARDPSLHERDTQMAEAEPLVVQPKRGPIVMLAGRTLEVMHRSNRTPG